MTRCLDGTVADIVVRQQVARETFQESFCTMGATRRRIFKQTDFPRGIQSRAGIDPHI